MSRAFERFAGWCALLAALAGVVFTVAFAIVVRDGHRWAQWVSWTTLLAGGLLTIPVMTALYALVAREEPQFALVGYVLGVAGALGAVVHGAYDVSVLANPPPAPGPGLPSGIDPRGLMTFGVSGLALLVFGFLLQRSGRLSAPLGPLALLGGALLVVVYVGRLTVLNPKANVIRLAALVSGLVVVPAFYALVGRTLLGGEPAGPARGGVEGGPPPEDVVTAP